MSESPHIADRPSWNCRACGNPWPCEQAKGSLTVEYRHAPTALAVYLANHWHEASRDLAGNDGDDKLWSRFLGWNRRARAAYERHQQGPMEVVTVPEHLRPHKIAGEETYLAASPADGADR